MAATQSVSGLEGQTITLFDKGVQVGTTTTDATGKWSFAANNLAIGQHSYVAKASDGTIVSQAWTITTNQALAFGSSHKMNVTNYIIVQAKPPLDVPSQAKYIRQATGGTPPYTYSSADATVAQVNSSGEVTARGNGTSVITVTDSNRNTAQYHFTVSGIVYVRQGETANWGPTVSHRPWLPYALSVDQMKVFYSLYKSVGNIESYLGWAQVNEYWTSTNLPNDHAKTFLLRTGVESDKQGGTQLRYVHRL